MNTINKQKFLAELGKLLTFMYEEDRQTALAMYVKMFEDTEDEQALIQALVSPTRQAVIVARAYNAKMRKLQVEAQSREAAAERVDDEATPDFILAINQVYQDAVHIKSAGTAPLENQYSLFEEAVFPEEAEEEPVEEAQDEEPVEEVQNEEPDEAVQDEEADEEPDEEAEEQPVEETVEAPVEEAYEEEEAETEEGEESTGPVMNDEPAEESESSEASAAAMDAAAAAAPLFILADAGEEDADADKDAVDAFLEDFSLEDDTFSFDEEDDLMMDEAESEADPVLESEALAEAELEDEEISDDFIFRGTVRKAKPLLLILYILLAIPITLALVALLLVPTLLFLGLAGCAIVAGAAFFVSAFSGFPVLADILIVLGAALITLALGLLFLWVFIWFIGGAIVGLIRGVVSLGARWCYKEVSA